MASAPSVPSAAHKMRAVPGRILGRRSPRDWCMAVGDATELLFVGPTGLDTAKR